jgi:hypothetical protein
MEPKGQKPEREYPPVREHLPEREHPERKNNKNVHLSYLLSGLVE